MLDFFMIAEKPPTKQGIEIYPKFIIRGDSADLMVKGRDFYAVWNEKTNLWSMREDDVKRQIDEALTERKKEIEAVSSVPVNVKYMWDADSGSMERFHKYVQRHMRDCFHPLDERIIFSNQETTKDDYASKKLPYPLEEGSIESYEELISTLYDKDERDKLEWAIGAIISGDAKEIQKFIVLYGSAGSGKSTVLNIIQMLFDGYYSLFNAKQLTSNSEFALESFKNNPLVSIQHDGDLSRIEDNTRLNSIVSHEMMEINEKYKGLYAAKFNTFLFMGTNKPVKITEAKSGLIRRLIDVTPSGRKIPFRRYQDLMGKIKFELGGIAWHCLSRYKEMGDTYYDDYIPKDMISATNDFYDFVDYYYDDFAKADSITLTDAMTLYKAYCDYAKVQYPMSRRAFKTELMNYFESHEERARTEDGKRIRNLYSGFLKDKFSYAAEKVVASVASAASWLTFDCTVSIFDKECSDCIAQYAKADGKSPKTYWKDVKTHLSDINTSEIHYVKVPENHIVIDFDLKNENGEKDFMKNLEAASKWPKTYAELSKSGSGIHLHYIYSGDPKLLEKQYAEDIEVKVFTGNSALRRKVTKCNDLPIATIGSGLRLKGEKNVVDMEGIKSEKALRSLIRNCLAKKHHGATKPEVDYIYAELEKAYNNGVKYDVTDLRPAIFDFASSSTHQSEACLKLVSKMKWSSVESEGLLDSDWNKAPIVIYDVEVYPNLFVICWKFLDSDNVVKMRNPSPLEVEKLLNFRLVDFNGIKYDRIILLARIQGYSNAELYQLSKRIINNSRNVMIGQSKHIGYLDVFDMCSKKQSLKKWELELGEPHVEMGIPWDKPVPEELWDNVEEYCANDVRATEAVLKNRHADFVAREILADVAGMTVNDTTNTLTTNIIFGSNKNPQAEFNYRGMGNKFEIDHGVPGYDEFTVFTAGGFPIFPGYTYDGKKSLYRGEEVGEGGYVYAEPGIYYNVALLDIASMHPSSIVAENLFGDRYTRRFQDILEARIAIKHKDFEKAKTMLDGKLAKYLTDEDSAADLAQALKIAINSVYGLTAARFKNPFKDDRNIDNIVAKRGALFMVNLKHEVQKRGFVVAHIKTDSIKIPNATPEIISFVQEYGRMYGYNFEHEATYERMCLVNDAVYIAKYLDGDHAGEWTATGKQFQVPYVFKTLFSKEEVVIKDLCETFSCTTALYLDLNESLPEGEHDYQFIGRVGQFCPVKPGLGGGVLYREKDGKYYAASGTTGYRWKESPVIRKMNKINDIDFTYYDTLADKAISAIETYGNFDNFVNGPVPEMVPDSFMNVPEGIEEEIPF